MSVTTFIDIQKFVSVFKKSVTNIDVALEAETVKREIEKVNDRNKL